MLAGIFHQTNPNFIYLNANILHTIYKHYDAEAEHI